MILETEDLIYPTLEYVRMVHLIIHLVLLVTIVGTASLWVPKSMALNVLVASDLSNGMQMQMQARQYLNVSTGFYLVLQPDCNVILYNRSQPIMSTNTSCGNTTINTTLTITEEYALALYQNQSVMSGDTSSHYLWGYYWSDDVGSAPSFPYMILRATGSCDFYDFNGNHLNGSDLNGDPSFLQRYWGPVPRQAPNASALSSLPDIAYPFPPELAWKPQASLDNFPYLPAGYFLSQGSQLQTVDKGFSLVLGPGCNLQSKRSLDQNGSAVVLWDSGSRNSSKGGSCELTLQEDGRLVTRNSVSGAIYWNSSTVAGNVSASWVLRLSEGDGSLSIGDIENSSNILWTNIHPDETNRATTWIVVGVTVSVFVLAMAGSALFYFYARTKVLPDPAEKAFRRRLEEAGGKSQTRFSEAQIKQATSDFRTNIGSGGFGDVFYGKLPNGQEIAAKVLSAESHQSNQEFYNEIELLSVVHHKYLVSLLGYRYTQMQQILVYEYMKGGDLRHRLQGDSAAENPLTWRQRTSIALQVAEGLEYLHDKCSPSIIHRDVKSTNILLTDKVMAKVADFGLSKLRRIDQEDATHVTTVVKGTPGYLDPEYHETGMLTDKSDVYAFGIVMMEILTGQNQIYIAHRVAEAWRLESGIYDLPDPNLGGEYERCEFVSLVELSLWCVRKRSGDRPFMRQVVRRFREMGLAPLETPQPESILEDEDAQITVPLDIELEETEEFGHSYALPLTDSSCSGMSSDVRHSGLQFRESGR